MEYRIYKAKTVNDAITDALIELEITSDMIEYEVVEEGSAGLLGLFSKEAVIRARKKEEAVQEEEPFDIKSQFRTGSFLDPQKPKQAKKSAKPAGEHSEQKKEKEAKEPGKTSGKNRQPAEKPLNRPEGKEKEQPMEEAVVRTPDEPYENPSIRDILQEIFKKLGIDAEITMTINRGERMVNVIVDGSNTGDLIGKRGQTLDAIQYLLSIIVNKEQEAYYRVKLDTNNYRERRQKTLENLARNTAAKVKKTRRKVVMEPMNPYERRVIHSYLQADRYVTTKSEGVEPNRRVVIYYKKS